MRVRRDRDLGRRWAPCVPCHRAESELRPPPCYWLCTPGGSTWELEGSDTAWTWPTLAAGGFGH